MPHTFQGVQPQLAKLGNKVFVAYAQDASVRVRSSADGGATFGPEVTLAVPGRMSVGMRRGPRIAVTASAVMVSVIAGARGGGLDGDLLLYRSVDGGATFGAPVVINDASGSAREGLHGFAANDQGFVILAWLDLRAPGTQIFAATSQDHGATWSADRFVYKSPSGTVCECCHPSVTPGRGNRGIGHAIMFRNSVDGNRDLHVTRSEDGISYSPARKSGVGSWKLDACPMDGGDFIVNGTDIVSVWRREMDVYIASPGRPERKLGPGRTPVIDRSGAHQDIAWRAPAGITLLRDGKETVVSTEGLFPAIASLGDQTVLAWENQGLVKVVSLGRK